MLLAAAGDFIEDDGGEGDYMDTGDDELFGSGAADEAAAGGKGKKRKAGEKGEEPAAAAAAATAGTQLSSNH
jgi:hypothetical protein